MKQIKYRSKLYWTFWKFLNKFRNQETGVGYWFKCQECHNTYMVHKFKDDFKVTCPNCNTQYLMLKDLTDHSNVYNYTKVGDV